MQFRNLKAEEVDVRVSQITDSKMTLLLYKDARCDMNILDETVGSMNWQRRHTRDNHNCIVSIWDAEKETWIEKEDVGSESNIEKDKGLASDSFKRACTNWGIGRELYTTPTIEVWKKNFKGEEQYTTFEKNNKLQLGYDNNLNVEKMIVSDDHVITDLVITNTMKKDTRVVFEYHADYYKCAICGKSVGSTMAKKSIDKYGAVLDSAECRDKWREKYDAERS